MDLDRFTADAFAAGDAEQREALARDLSLILTEELSSGGGNFHARAAVIVRELRRVGHDLWSFDESPDDFEVWCDDWTRPPSSRVGLVVHISTMGVAVSARELPIPARNRER